MKFFTSLLLLLSIRLDAATLPGLRVQALGATESFASSLAIDSKGTIYYTTQTGGVYRLGQRAPIAAVITDLVGNSGLIGMALLDDKTAVVHYTTPNQTHDVISRIDLTTGAEAELHRFVCDVAVPSRGTSGEHHGGNPAIGPNGSVFVGIGDYGVSGLALQEG